jgi:transcriptional regulator with XRE-family HTH domain
LKLAGPVPSIAQYRHVLALVPVSFSRSSESTNSPSTVQFLLYWYVILYRDDKVNVNPAWSVGQPNLAYAPDMGLRELTDSRFGKRVREERVRRGWSQEELAKRLTDKGVLVHSSTIAKIEAEKRPRAARLVEVVGIADLFELSVDALLDRQSPDDSTLTFALSVLSTYAGDAERQIQQARDVVADIEDQLESVEESFDLPGIDGLRQAAQDMAAHLETARSTASTLASMTSGAIVEPTTKSRIRSPGRTRVDESQPQGRGRGPLDQDRSGRRGQRAEGAK